MRNVTRWWQRESKQTKQAHNVLYGVFYHLYCTPYTWLLFLYNLWYCTNVDNTVLHPQCHPIFRLNHLRIFA
jgi:hypothetical protein